MTAQKTECMTPQALCIHRFDEQDKKLDQILTCLEGNGKPGLKTDVATLQRAYRIWSKSFWIIVSSIGATSLTIATGYILWKLGWT